MLTYAFQILRQNNYDKIESEDFDDIYDLFAAIIAKGTAQQIKQGLYKEYITEEETMSVLRGKIVLSETIKNEVQRNKKLACEFDELSVNNIFNQILKTTIFYLLKHNAVKDKRKIELKKVWIYFDSIELLQPSAIKWNRLLYQRNNRNYEMLMNICYFVLTDLILTTEKGEYKITQFSDDNMARLYEKFILEYYRKHHTYLNEVKSGEVKWNLKGEHNSEVLKFLPKMQTDVMLKYGNKTLIIDAKYYKKCLQEYKDSKTIVSNNLYQIFAYVKNETANSTTDVAGLLLYAKTNEEITPDNCIYNIGDNIIGAKTLNLNKDFSEISKQLDKIAEDYFQISDTKTTM